MLPVNTAFDLEQELRKVLAARIRRNHCRRCGTPLLGRLWHWCADCWIQFAKGAAAAAGAAVAAWLLRQVLR